MSAARRRLAVVLFNLGGPDGPAAVRPFLFNLFADPAIIRLPGPARLALAALISEMCIRDRGEAIRLYVFIDWKNSPLFLVCRNLSIRNSIASWAPMGLRMRRRT